MAMETTQTLVLQSCLSVWRMPGISKYVWPNVGHGFRLLQSSERLDVAVGIRGLSARAENHARVSKETAMYQLAMRRVRESQSISCGRDVESRHVLRPSLRGTAEMLVSVYRRNVVELRRGVRTAAWLRRQKEEGDWQFSPEWWGTQGGSWGRNAGETVFESLSTMGNGVISVTAHPASTPIPEEWAVVEKELQERQASRGHGQFKVLGYEWRVLRFNSITRQSVAKVMAVTNDQPPTEVFLVQQPNCIAFEYVKSMLSVGLSTISLAGYNLDQVTHRTRNMRILCVGLGGGSLPLFLAHNLPGATLDVVEIDGSVIEAAVETMGFPPCEIHRLQANVSSHGLETRNQIRSNVPGGHLNAGHEYAINQEVLWGGLLNRVTVYEADGEHFVEDLVQKRFNEERLSRQYYDLVFVDAFDGEDVVPTKLWTRDGAFLKNLNKLLHPKHGTVVVNLHTDSPPPSILEKVTGQYRSGFDPSLSQGRKIQEACCTYRDVLLPPETGTGPTAGLAFTVAVPSQGNISLVVSRGLSIQSHLDSQSQNQQSAQEKQMFVEKLQAESKYVQKVLNTRLDFFKRVSRGFQVVQGRVSPAKVLQ
uniref:PABS domain-containing protein n=1 Tax=Physcomitrium patens TaxID=3218 RepID=A0A7I4B0K6_PHYPA